MGWKDDISSWASKNNQEPEIVEGNAKREIKKGTKIEKGWDPAKYDSSTMKAALFDYLNQWYTLSVKTMPIPATTALRKNPIQSKTQKFTKLSNGWKIWTVQDQRSLTHSTIASNGPKYLEYGNNTLLGSLQIHQHLIKRLKKILKD